MNEPNDSGISGLPDMQFASARLGIIGGGQLARMTGLAALSPGSEVGP